MGITVPFFDLTEQNRLIRKEIDNALNPIFENAQFVLGPAVSRFEKNFAAYCDVSHCIAVNSGTSALHLSLLAAGIKPGDEVIVPAMTFVATIAAVLYIGAKPVLVDVDLHTRNLDPSLLVAAINQRTRAIVPVHLHGLMADMEKILSIAENANIVVIEDAAQAHGAEYKGRRAGTLGLAGCYSFYPGKNLGAYGEAGAVVTNDDGIANKIRMYRDWGQEEKYSHVLKGFNYRMDGIQGAVLDVKLKYIEKWTETRRRVAEAYTSVFKDYEITTPDAPPEFRHVYHVYAVLAANREKTISYLSDQGIGTNIHYSAAVHLQPAYVDLGYTEGDFPISEWLGRSFISLPMFPELTPEQIRYVCNQVILALEPAQFIEATFC